MNTSWQKASLVLGLLLLTACGETSTPIALQTIDPRQDASGDMLNLLANETTPINLIDAVVKQGVPRKVATTAFLKFDQFQDQMSRTEHLAIIDFTQHSSQKRFFIIERSSGKVSALTTAHGVKSDPNKDGIAEHFSNIPESRMSSLGAYKISERYVGKYGPSLKLDGLETTNDKVRERTIVLHPSNYVRDGRKRQGWSWGCPAVPYAWIDTLITNLRDGAFMYAYGVNTYKETSADIFMQTLTMAPDYRWVNESEEAPEDGCLTPQELAEEPIE